MRAFDGVHIRCCGNGHLGFRSYSGSLLANACRSELAREKPEGAAFIQDANVIVNDLREQARSHIWTVPAFDLRRPVKPRWPL